MQQAYLSLSFCCHGDKVALDGVAHFSHEEKHVGSGKLSEMQNQRRSHAFFQDVQKASPDECCKTQEAVEASVPTGKSLNWTVPPFRNCRPWVLPVQTPTPKQQPTQKGSPLPSAILRILRQDQRFHHALHPFVQVTKETVN
ncbi:hypothetical protein Celaphus_00003898 [Cervus elaphus hippelaphus]|uniref:Ferritin light chain n=1 Tax=Cervus elaphus hippelaphus TaxID=46360 RepID=A0A212D0R9_CEREH|nr:hypothetical protein Celaphus_00003898 [Cervus elaphus hippelaphus]